MLSVHTQAQCSTSQPGRRSAPRQRRRALSTSRSSASAVDALVTIGTRGSPLALAQAHLTRDLLQAKYSDLRADGAVALRVIKTTGDKVLDQPLADLGGKGLFTREIDDALLDGRVDIAVHSMKDVPTTLAGAQHLECCLEREDVRDVFVSRDHASLASLPDHSVIGSASLRRASQLLAMNPTWKVVNFRGNVQRRLRKIEEGDVDATLLAHAGLRRLGLTDNITELLSVDDMLPAVAQGAIGIACRDGDDKMAEYLSGLDHADTHVAVKCEREFLRGLDGSCRTPIAGHCRRVGDGFVFDGLVASPDGKTIFTVQREGAWSEEAAVAAGRDAAAELKTKAGKEFFDWVVASATAGFADLKS